MAAAGSKVIMDCPYGCRIKFTEVLRHVVNSDGEVTLVCDEEQVRLAHYAHMVGMHA